ncbi:MAG: MCE family protein [Actinomycetota bacterium]|nr:MCE family protein [Actinomycetota bacterium]
MRAPRTLARLVALTVIGGFLLAGCSGSSGGRRVYKAEFSRTIQLFPAANVRVLGVNVGEVLSTKVVNDGVLVTFRVDDPSVQIPSNVDAAIVPMSLLGERYIQLFPAYTNGPTLPSGSTIPLSRTAVPSEPDELLQSLQDYMGALDPQTVTTFVENASKVLQGNGTRLNSLIRFGSELMQTLSAKRNDLAALFVQLDKLTDALATRQKAIGTLIQSYNAVTGTLNANRAALEGTIQGLNDAAVQLASLLVAHRKTLNQDIESLTRTGRTLSKNVGQLAETGHWAVLLFQAATRAVDYDHAWLRLGNQGQELGALILLRLQERLAELCLANGDQQCGTMDYWSQSVPALFCFQPTGCGGGAGQPSGGSGSSGPTVARAPQSGSSSYQASVARALTRAVNSSPKVHKAVKAQATSSGTTVYHLMDRLLKETVGNPDAAQGAL